MISKTKVIMENDLCWIIKNGKIALSARKQGDIIQVKVATTTEETEQKEGEFIDYHR